MRAAWWLSMLVVLPGCIIEQGAPGCGAIADGTRSVSILCDTAFAGGPGSVDITRVGSVATWDGFELAASGASFQVTGTNTVTVTPAHNVTLARVFDGPVSQGDSFTVCVVAGAGELGVTTPDGGYVNLFIAPVPAC